MAPQPLKNAKSGGAGKEAIAATGGGKKTLKTWRSLNDATKEAARGYAKTAEGGLTEVVKGYRAARAQRGVNPTSGLVPGSKPGPSVVAMEQRRASLATAAKATAAAKTGGPSVPEMKGRRVQLAKAAKAVAKPKVKGKNKVKLNGKAKKNAQADDALGKALAKQRAAAKYRTTNRTDYSGPDARALTRKARTTMRMKGKK